MYYYLGGAEVPSHRKLMNESGATHVALSYMGLRRKVKFARPWVIADKFNDDIKIFLDSGGYTVNRGDDKYSQRELMDIADHYRQFVQQNIERLELVSEFDALPLGRDWIEQDRADFYSTLPRDKFMVIWHPEWGLDNLRALAEEYQHIGIPSTSLGERNLAPLLNQIASTGVNIHGVGITSVDDMQSIRWHAVSSTSWISPQQYGDTIVWTGRELKRYPKKYKEQARKRYRTLFEREGFDSAKIEADDHTELLRLSIWSWQRLMDDIDKKRPIHLRAVTNPTEDPDLANMELDGEVVVTPPEEMRKSLATVKRRETVPIPVLGASTTVEKVVGDDGVEEDIERTSYTLRTESTRMCDTCFLASKCPAFEPASNCAYNIPFEVKTKDDFKRVQDTILEMQVQRVMFMRMAEDAEGGYADPNLSSELDRLQKMLKSKHEMEQDGFSFKMDIKSQGSGAGGPGMLARLFGDQASQKAQALPAPVPVENVLDAEVVTDWTDV